MNDKLFSIILATIPIICIIITSYVIPFIKSKIKLDKLDEICKWTNIAVKGAEMLFPEQGMGIKKKEYVLNFLKRFFGDVFTEEQLDVLIESFVEELKKEL